jgi:hypothetical protein
MAPFEIVPEGACWSERGYVSAALIPIAPEKLAELVGAPLVRGVESGLGGWEAVGLRLRSGTLIELIRYVAKPDPQGFEVRIGNDTNIAVALREVIAFLGVPPQALAWVSPHVRA